MANIETKPRQNLILMGGGGNEAESFKLLLESANGGDIVVLSTKSKINHRYTHPLALGELIISKSIQ